MSSNAIDSTPLDAINLDALIATLSTGNLKKQLQAVNDLSAMNSSGDQALVDFIRNGLQGELTAAHGSAYQGLYASDSEVAQAFVTGELAAGLVMPKSEQDIDYGELQQCLIEQDYQSADKLTMQKLCELAGERAIARKWVYFTEVSQFSVTDLQTIDTLWRLYSEDKFGWSKQHELWMRLGQDWDRLWTQLIWKSSEGKWTRYPGEFIWDLSAPVGHLPLSNQLRGVRMMDSLLSHPAWG
ncbi:MAG: GUN4 N-terminal ARM-like repeat domain-containing protein [Cyanobacteria bacterium P01_D01_bin.36]